MLPAVLVVEKDALTRETIVYMLETMQYNVVAFEHVEEAISALRGVAFHVILISLDLYDPDGNTLAMEAKMVQRDLKAVVVSGRSPPAHLQPYIDAFVQKPFTLDQIDKALKQVMRPTGLADAN